MPAGVMSMFFLELVNRTGICYSKRSAVKQNEKEVVFSVDTLNLM